MEKWYNVKDFEGYYQVSDLGRLRRVRPTIDCGVEQVRILTTSPDSNGRQRAMILSSPKRQATYRTCSLIHDTLFPENAGNRFKHKDGNEHNLSKDNFILTDKPRRVSEDVSDTRNLVFELSDDAGKQFGIIGKRLSTTRRIRLSGK